MEKEIGKGLAEAYLEQFHNDKREAIVNIIVDKEEGVISFDAMIEAIMYIVEEVK